MGVTTVLSLPKLNYFDVIADCFNFCSVDSCIKLKEIELRALKPAILKVKTLEKEMNQPLMKSGKSSESLNSLDLMSLESLDSLVTFFSTERLTNCSMTFFFHSGFPR
jgi:hypothetical protein